MTIDCNDHVVGMWYHEFKKGHTYPKGGNFTIVLIRVSDNEFKALGRIRRYKSEKIHGSDDEFKPMSYDLKGTELQAVMALDNINKEIARTPQSDWWDHVPINTSGDGVVAALRAANKSWLHFGEPQTTKP